MEARVSPYAGRITPTCDIESDLEVEEPTSASDGDETRAIGLCYIIMSISSFVRCR